MMLNRREFLRKSALTLTSFFLPLEKIANAASKDEVIWSGVYYGVPTPDVPRLLNAVSQGIEASGGLSVLQKKCFGLLASTYGAENVVNGVLEKQEVETSSLYFMLTFDFEQFLDVPDIAGGASDKMLGIVFNSIKVVQLSLGDEDVRGRFKVKYTIPFYTKFIGDRVPHKTAVKNMLYDSAGSGLSIVDYYANKINGLGFKEIFCTEDMEGCGQAPLNFRVSKVNIQKKAVLALEELGISKYLSESFIGNSLASALSMKTSAITSPFGSTYAFSSYDGFPSIFFERDKVASITDAALSAENDDAYELEVTLIKVIRKKTQSSKTRRGYKRILVFGVKVFDGYWDRKQIFKTAIAIDASGWVPTSLIKKGRVKELEAKAFSELTITVFEKLFDGVANSSWDTLGSIGMKKDKTEKMVNDLRVAISKSVP